MAETKIIESLRNLHDMLKAVNSSLKPAEVVEIICHKTAALMGSPRVLLLLLDEADSSLTVHHYFGFTDQELAERVFKNIKPFDHCIVHKGMVITLDEVLAPGDQPRLRQSMPVLFDMVFAPLEIQGKAYGLLGVVGEAAGFPLVELEIFCSLSSQAAVALENANLYDRLHTTFLHTAEALAEAVNSRDPYTGGHTRRVQEYSLQLAQALDMSAAEQEDLRLAAILHDIGKIGIDDAILRKSGKLDPAERQQMKEHPDIGARILSYVDEMGGVIPGVRHHHEWYDGSGYPLGLAGDDIPLQARIIAITDVYDALTTDRPYRKAMTVEAAFAIINDHAGSHFDPRLLDIFYKSFSS